MEEQSSIRYRKDAVRAYARSLQLFQKGIYVPTQLAKWCRRRGFVRTLQLLVGWIFVTTSVAFRAKCVESNGDHVEIHSQDEWFAFWTSRNIAPPLIVRRPKMGKTSFHAPSDIGSQRPGPTSNPMGIVRVRVTSLMSRRTMRLRWFTPLNPQMPQQRRTM
jgi:hypothetical protein